MGMSLKTLRSVKLGVDMYRVLYETSAECGVTQGGWISVVEETLPSHERLMYTIETL